MTTPSRASLARHTALTAIATMIPALLVHELISFTIFHSGIRWSDAECLYIGCVGISIVLFMKAVFAIALGLLFAIVAAILGQFWLRRAILTTLWVVVCIAQLFSTASVYKSHFGATWRWYEPFAELMFHPIITPLIVIGGAWIFARTQE